MIKKRDVGDYMEVIFNYANVLGVNWYRKGNIGIYNY